MKKSLIFKILYLFLVLIVCAGASVFATTTFLASQVSYGSTNVEEALNGLFTLKENTYNYSTNEQIVGRWTNNKPIYRKVFNGTTPDITTSNVTTSLLVSNNLDELISLTWSLIDSANYKYSGEGTFCTTTLGFAAWLNDENYIRVRVGSSPYCSRPIKYIVLYTKTTD